LEIVKERSGDFLNVRVSGRLDNHWSQPFDEAIAEMIREGAHHLRLDLSEVNYLSSAGIGVLMNAYRDTNELNGSFLISAASDRVRTVLRLVELESLLFASGPENAAPLPSTGGPRQVQSEKALFECYSLDGGICSAHRFLGDPAKLSQGGYGAEDTTPITVREDLFALGVGALGASYDDCRSLFGEFVAAAGSAAYMPTDGTSTPDYMMRSGELVPEIQALYAIEFRGSPSHLLRFEASNPGDGVPLSEVVRVCASVAGTPEFGVVMAAEVSGLVCALLRRSPAQPDPARFDFPSVREWLSFLPEHEYARTSSIVVGFASASPSEEVRPFLRPISDAFCGHFHAAVTAFRSLARGKVKISEVLAQAFQPRSVVSVVHLLRDSRPIEGAGESEFQRGACWVFPIANGDAP
jgi:anti-anti-sigma factor